MIHDEDTESSNYSVFKLEFDGHEFRYEFAFEVVSEEDLDL